jgi:hypothetical protein
MSNAGYTLDEKYFHQHWFVTLSKISCNSWIVLFD